MVLQNSYIMKTRLDISLALGLGVLAALTSQAAVPARTDITPAGAVSVDNGRGRVEVTPLTDHIFRVRHYAPGRESTFLDSQSAVLEPGHHALRPAVFTDAVELYAPTATIRIDKNSGKVSLLSPGGATVLQEAGGIDNSDPSTKSISFLNPGNGSFYGGGERGHSLRINGDSLTMYNRQNYGYGKGDPRISQMGISVPYFVSDAGYGVLVDDYSRGLLTLGADTIRYTSETPHDISYYLIVGDPDAPTLRRQTDLYTELTGRQPLPPLWSLGYITSKYGYKTRQEAEEVVDRLKKGGYPLDGMVLDLYWYGVEQDMGRLEWNKEKWPDHAAMLKNLKDKGVNMVLISQPYVNKGGAIDNYNILSEAGMLAKDADGKTHDVTTWVGDAGMLDVSNPETRGWLWNRLKGLTAEGVAGWWGDLGEPEVHPATILHANGQTAEQYHNAYGNQWSQLIYEGLRKDFPDQRPLLMMRGGTAGLQRYGVFPWTTDVARSWAGLQPQITLMLSSGLSGLGYMGSDIGGFAVDPEHPTDPELYVRWLQMGAFSPMLRTHAQEQPEPYNYPEMEPISKKFIKMRYEWLPYNYTLAFENATTGAPLARPLNFDNDAADKKLFANEQTEYMWGDDVLVAPVMERGARQRKVLFPAGEWVNWNNPSLRYKGGRTAVVKAPLSELPLFVRAGAVIPQYTRPIENTTQYYPEFLTLKYFPSADASESVVFDDNHVSTTSIEDKAYQLTHIAVKPEGKKTAFRFTSEGSYEGMPTAKEITLEMVDCKSTPAEVALDGRGLSRLASATASGEGWRYDAKTRTLTLRFTWNYDPAEVVVKF